MLTGHITFAAKVTSPIAIQTKEPFDVDEIPGVEKATVDLTDVNKARITIKFAQVESDETGKEVAEQLTRELIEGLATQLMIGIGEPRITELGLHEFPERPNAAYMPCVVAHASVMEPTIKTGKMLSAKDVEGLVQFLKQPNPPGKADFGLFRLVLQCEDRTQEFMLLYSLLMAYTGTRIVRGKVKQFQDEVDTFIRKHEPGVEERLSPHTKQNETIYSWLRNEVGHHTRSGTTVKPLDIRREMTSKLQGLRALVRKAIDER